METLLLGMVVLLLVKLRMDLLVSTLLFLLYVLEFVVMAEEQLEKLVMMELQMITLDVNLIAPAHFLVGIASEELPLIRIPVLNFVTMELLQ